jgi:hypothetical protein
MSEFTDKLADAYLLIKLCVVLGAIGVLSVTALLAFNTARPFLMAARWLFLGGTPAPPPVPPGWAPPPSDVAAGLALGMRILAWSAVVAAGLGLWSCRSEGKGMWDRVHNVAGSIPRN